MKAAKIWVHENQFLPKLSEFEKLISDIGEKTVTVSSCSMGCQICEGSGWIVGDDQRARRCPSRKLMRMPLGKCEEVSYEDRDGAIRTAFIPRQTIKALPPHEAVTKEDLAELDSAISGAAKAMSGKRLNDREYQALQKVIALHKPPFAEDVSEGQAREVCSGMSTADFELLWATHQRIQQQKKAMPKA